MTRLVAYIFEQVEQKQLSRHDALLLLQELSQPAVPHELKGDVPLSTEEPAPDCTTLLLEPQWHDEPVREAVRPWQARQVLLCGVDNELDAGALAGATIWRTGIEGDIGQRFSDCAAHLLQTLQGITASHPAQPVLVQVVVPAEGAGAELAGLAGMLRSAAEEDPKIVGQVLQVDATISAAQLVAALQAEAGTAQARVRYVQGARQVSRLQVVGPRGLQEPDSQALPLARHGGVYLITGGAGGVGLLFAQALARTPGVTLILVGRGELDAGRRERIQALEAGGATVSYQRVDVADAPAVQNLVDSVMSAHGRLDGVIHAAGVLKDKLLRHQNEQELHEVLAPKVSGLVNLDKATHGMALGWFVAFSSTAAVLGNAGQAGYAAANAFMDEYMRARQGRASGRSLSINWPLWEDGGMQIDAVGRERMRRDMGLVPLGTAAGVQALEQALRLGASQIAVLAGDEQRLQWLAQRQEHWQEQRQEPTPPQQMPTQPVPAVDAEWLQVQAVRYLTRLLGEELKLPVDRIDVQTPLEQFGLDSVRVMQLTRRLEDNFGPLPKTLFYEHQTIGALAAHLMRSHGTKLASLLGARSHAVALPVGLLPPASQRISPPAASQHTSPRPQRDSASHALDIAIIGLGGRYPQAPDLPTFWRNLRDGVNSITEVPADRWDHSRHFDVRKGQPGKTYAKWGGFMDGVDRFDPLFFSISPLEAARIDPQERLFLQTVYETLEDSGYTRERLGSNVGVYVGVMYEEYQLYGAESQLSGDGGFALPGSPSSIANRVSYWCNFHGPSLAVDTMCSSSLTAIHLACHGIARGDCETAVAGGVNLSVHPNKFMMLAQGQFASTEGLCRSFGAGGDGYVPGEGVGAVLLKPLARAIDDGDHIYGVIKGSSINHGGRTHGYTVPNPTAQAELIAKTIREANVDPRAISFIEAHGTGTSLGDPIEIAGLSKAFGESSGRQYCAIGSAKSNIGHCESAAGIAGLTKVLLQMQHKTLAKSLHSEELNPHIDFSQTPFKVQQVTSEWRRPVVDGREEMRIAGISSFGAGGGNAHLIVQEYEAAEQARAPRRPVLVVLSARNEEQLQEQARRLRGAITGIAEEALEDVAYTLQVGREAMAVRLACVAQSLQELGDALDAYTQGKTAAGLYHGKARRGHDLQGSLAEDDDMHATVQAWVAKGKLDKLADLWTQGLMLDWRELQGPVPLRRIALPTYPFSRERYWVRSPSHAAPHTSNAEPQAPAVHALLQTDTSDSNGQRYSSRFTGEEFFLNDHQVRGRKVLPGVGQLEMAMQAVQRSTGQASSRIRLQDVVFVRPVVIDGGPLQVHIALRTQESGVSYEIYAEAGRDKVVYGQGRAVLRDAPQEQQEDLAALSTQCTRSLDAGHIYAAFTKLGVQYGSSFQSLQSLQIGQDTHGTLVVGELSLPAVATSRHGEFQLHPSLLDAALQACLGLMDDASASQQTRLPFALEQLDMWRPVPPRAKVVIRYSAGSGPGHVVSRLDLNVIDEQGRVCVRLGGFSTRVIAGQATPRQATHSHAPTDASPAVTTAGGEVSLIPVWEPFKPEAAKGSPEPDLIVAADDEALRSLGWEHPQARRLLHQNATLSELEALLPIEHVLWVAPAGCEAITDEDTIMSQEQGVLGLLRLVKVLHQLGHDTRRLRLSVLTRQTQAVNVGDVLLPSHASVHGLVGSLAKEFAHWQVCLLDLPAQMQDWPFLSRSLWADPQGNAIAYRSGQWYRQRHLPCRIPDAAGPAFRQQGVYVILGGAGGIGRILSEHLIRHYQAQVVWVGRRALDDTISLELQRLGQLGPMPMYLSADAADRAQLQAACDQIKNRHGAIHGVVHATIVLQDQSLARMDEATFKSGLDAKVNTSVRLAQVFQAEALDFVLFFSSMQSSIKAAGQSNYAAGCTFSDACAQALRQTGVPVKVINWGYWGSVGIVATPQYRERMTRMGLGSIEPPEAMALVERLLGSPIDQVAYFKTLGASTQTRLAMDEDRVTVLPAAEHDAPAAELAQPSALAIPELLKDVSPTQAFEALLVKLLWVQLDGMGLFRQPMNVQAWRASVHLPALYGRWLDHSLRLLEAQGLRPDTKLPATQLWEEWESYLGLANEAPHQRAQAKLADVMLRALPRILRGQQPATGAMFPGASMGLVEGIYQHNPVSDYFNEVVAESLCRYVEGRLAREPQARLRLIEIGAGTGGTSARLFARLAPHARHIAEYSYTDLSKAFLLHAQTHYAAKAPYLTTRAFDVSRALAEQGIEPGSYDVAIATNVLHATRDIRQTLRNTKALLKSQGLLLLNEINDSSAFLHLTFGLLEGWWLYDDEALRVPGSPALSAQGWNCVLRGEGFQGIGCPAEPALSLGQNVVVAISNGVIRQSVPAALAVRQPPVAQPKVQPVPQAGQADAADLRAKVEAMLTQAVSQQLQIAVENLDSDAEFGEFGFDSISLTGFCNQLNERYGLELTPPVVFEYPTLAKLSAHLARDHADILAAALLPKVRMAEPRTVNAPQAGPTHGADLRAKVEAMLTQAVSLQLQIAVEELASDAEFGEFGFDSISLTGFCNQLNERYGLDLTPPVVFEYPTLAKLSAHLALDQADRLAAQLLPKARHAATPLPGPSVTDSGDAESLSHSRVDAAPAGLARTISDEPIAVIGVSGSFPQARDLDGLWENLSEGRDCVEEIPDSRWNWRELFGDPKKEANKTNARRAGLMEDMTEFDPVFFGISPAEAQGMDPQQRLLMTHVWRVLEDAGYAPHGLSGSDTAIFMGTTGSGYGNLLAKAGAEIQGSSATGGAGSLGPNRMSYLLDLHGPSEPIETACSSALVAIHKAVQAIRTGDSRLAIAGGINTLVMPELQVAFSKAGMLCEDGKCKTFSKHANGYVRGEGIGVLLLKRLSHAEADGDHIYGLIRGSAQNHGGRANSLTAPNPRAQAEVIKAAFTRAGVDPGTVSYIEAHGTGTPLGDPIEIQGLKLAFRELNPEVPEGNCGLGSVKTNIGHLELAAGVAGVMKVLLQMKHRTLAPSLHCDEINPYIQLEGCPFYVVRERKPWLALRDDAGRELPRRAGVSSFGFGGVNAHVVLEEYLPQPAQARGDQGPVIVVLSARNEAQLKEMAMQLLQAVQHRPQEHLADIAYTLQVGRDPMEVRLACVVDSPGDLCKKLEAYVQGTATNDLFKGEPKRHKETLSLFAADEDVQLAIGAWVAKGKLGKLADAWTKGLSVDWQGLHGDARPRRISLPTYPFARERFWVELPQMDAAADGAAAVVKDGKEDASRGEDNGKGDGLSVREALLRQLSGMTGHAVAVLVGADDFDAVGMDSVQRIQFIGKATRLYPALESREEDLLKAPSLTALLSIAEQLMSSPPSVATEAPVSMTDDLAQSVDILSSIKTQSRDLQCHSLQIVSNHPLALRCGLQVDESHPFYFDHELDHVSGIQLVEAAAQLARVGAGLQCLRSGPSNPNQVPNQVPNKVPVLTGLKASFGNFCKKDQDAVIDMTQGPTPEAQSFNGHAFQEGKKLLDCTFSFSHTELPDAVGREKQARTACAAAIVNKRNPQNVFISDRVDSKNRTGCWLVHRPDLEVFGSSRELGTVDAIYLAEACRQAQRLFTHHATREGRFSGLDPSSGQGGAPALMAALKSIELVLLEELRADADVFIEESPPEIVKVGRTHLLTTTNRLIVQGKKVGKFEMKSLILDLDVYKSWRDDKVTSAFVAPSVA